MSVTPAALRAHLLESLSTLSNPHNLGLTVLISEPKRTSSIFPYTPIPPKCFQQEVLVVLSSDLPQDASQQGSESSASASSSSSPSKPMKKVLVSAISAYLYTFPSTPTPTSSSASASSSFSSQSSQSPSTAILYISKIDSSGYTPTPLPLTRVLIISFLSYFIHQIPNIRVQLFARAQKQYLFANSSNSGKKKVLGGSGLCKWWKSVYEQTASTYLNKRSEDKDVNEKPKVDNDTKEQINLKLNYLLPGYEEFEAVNLLGGQKDNSFLSQNSEWEYKPPFITSIVPSAATGITGTSSSSSTSSLPESLATLIPSLPDDPKTRFLEELVTDSLQSQNPLLNHGSKKSSEANGPKGGDGVMKQSKKERETQEELSERKAAHLALSKIHPKEFWERIGFRQECGQEVTGFFTLKVSRSPPNSKKDLVQGSDQVQAQEKVGGSVTSEVFKDSINTEQISSLDPESQVSSSNGSNELATLPTPSTSLSVVISSLDDPMNPATASKTKLLRQEILDRLLTALTNVDFATLALAIEGTEIWLKQAESIVKGEIGQSGWETCLGTIHREEGLHVAPTTSGARKEREAEKVTMLMPRKKKKV
ncbi:uncharacterized protein IL334_002747 [Kwoniella shivajii]|uniref:histone acetyltransferase n=1 Tax=Kwoniella shivajii TaxID=564305 RepID=A0ABZ1CVK9_9TREE|nr:hypothetical protein IL334_002747 [Kwoniella shivajii]